MTIATEAQKQSEIREFLESRREMQQGITTTYHQVSDLLMRLTALQENAALWAQAEEGTLGAELHQLHRAVIPVESDAYISQIAAAAQALRVAVETADVHSGGAWFGITQGGE